MNLRSLQPPVLDPFYPELKEYVIRATGLAYYADKDDELGDRFAQRMSRLGLPDCRAYLGLLQDGSRGEAELDQLVIGLTIGETYFFRHSEQFEALRDVILPDLIERNANRKRLRIWSAGCSTGAEPYSVAMVLRSDLGERTAGWEVSILGTDINRDFLARAQEGCYDEWSLRSTPEEVRRRCFLRSGQSWIVAPEYRHCVTFQYHNLVRNPFPSLLNNLVAFDLILCRNVTIYFEPQLTRRLINQFHRTLVDEGWLLVGHAEPNTSWFRSFRTVNRPGATLYQKSDSYRTPTPALAVWWEAEPAPVALPEAAPLEPRAPLSEEPVLANHEAAEPQLAPSSQQVPAMGTELARVRSLADRGQWEEAGDACHSLLDKNPLDPWVHFYRALVLEQLGFDGEAERSLRRAVYLDRRFILAHYHLGLFLQKRRNVRGAKRCFENVLHLAGSLKSAQPLEGGDGLTREGLEELTQMHLNLLGR